MKRNREGAKEDMEKQKDITDKIKQFSVKRRLITK
jgi:hypothetical protein